MSPYALPPLFTLLSCSFPPSLCPFVYPACLFCYLCSFLLLTPPSSPPSFPPPSCYSPVPFPVFLPLVARPLPSLDLPFPPLSVPFLSSLSLPLPYFSLFSLLALIFPPSPALPPPSSLLFSDSPHSWFPLPLILPPLCLPPLPPPLRLFSLPLSPPPILHSSPVFMVDVHLFVLQCCDLVVCNAGIGLLFYCAMMYYVVM